MSPIFSAAAKSLPLSQHSFSPTRISPAIAIKPSSSRVTFIASVQAFADHDSSTGSRRSPTLYQILQIRSNASAVEIKSAYRKLAKRYHPDSSREVESAGGERFVEICKAYATLADPAARSKYDSSLRVRWRQPLRYVEEDRSRSWDTEEDWWSMWSR